MNHFKGSLFLLILLLCACGGPQNTSPTVSTLDLKERSLRLKLSNKYKVPGLGESLEYRYDDRQQGCFNPQGRVGRNLGYLAECGELSHVTATGLSLEGRSLKGLFVEHSDFDRVNFSAADLRSATFADVNLNAARFEGANLEAVRFDVNPALFEISESALQRSSISLDSRFPLIMPNPDYFSFTSLEKRGATLRGLESLRVGSPLEGIQLDSGFSQIKKDIVLNDLARLDALELDEAAGSLFQQAFGGGIKRNLLEFIVARIPRLKDTQQVSNVMVAQNLMIPESVERYGARLKGFLTKGFNKTLQMLNTFEPGSATSHYPEFANMNQQAPFFLPVPKNESGVQLGSLYFSTQLGTVARIGVLIHEARHSDCGDATGASQEFGNLLKNRSARARRLNQRLEELQSQMSTPACGSDAKIKVVAELQEIQGEYRKLLTEISGLKNELEQRPECGHRHITCPQAHADEALRGMAGACDEGTWGAYAVGAAYYQGVANSCKNCSELDKQEAMIRALDSLNRIVDLAKQWDDKRNGLEHDSSLDEL